jgi:hypothetical protein
MDYERFLPNLRAQLLAQLHDNLSPVPTTFLIGFVRGLKDENRQALSTSLLVGIFSSGRCGTRTLEPSFTASRFQKLFFESMQVKLRSLIPRNRTTNNQAQCCVCMIARH